MKIDAIVMPMIRGEIPELKSWLRHCPKSGQTGKTVYLSLDLEWTDAEKSSIRETFSRSPLREDDWKLEFIDCGMNPDESFYEKNGQAPIDLQKHPYGQKSGPNLQFFRSLRMLRRADPSIHAAVLMEVDAFPVVDDWLSLLQISSAQAPAGTLIAGAHYAGQSYLAPQIRHHFNGNSIYAIGHPDFMDFLDCWEALLLSSMRIAPFMAYDTVVSWYANYRDIHAGVRSLQCDAAERAAHFMLTRSHNMSHVLVNYGGDLENSANYKLDAYGFVGDFPHALIVHGKCFRESIHALRSARGPLGRRHHANLVAETILRGDIEKTFLLGLDHADLIRLLSWKIEAISPQQTKLVQREWNHDQ